MATTTTKATDATTLKQRYEDVRTRIAAAAERSGRRAQDIVLVAVTKFAAMDDIRSLIQLGHVDFGENRVQNLVQRAAQIDEYLERHHEMGRGGKRGRNTLPKSVRWHMIGHLQRNKVRKVLPLSRLIHSIDSLRLAEEIQSGAAKLDKPIEVLVEVNISGEKTKEGVAPAAVRHLIDQLDTMPHIRTRGLMTMAPIVEDPNDTRQYFMQARELFEDIKRLGIGGGAALDADPDEPRAEFNILSMGMSNDYEVAVECGANLVRVGSAIFGAKNESDDSPEED